MSPKHIQSGPSSLPRPFEPWIRSWCSKATVAASTFLLEWHSRHDLRHFPGSKVKFLRDGVCIWLMIMTSSLIKVKHELIKENLTWPWRRVFYLVDKISSLIALALNSLGSFVTFLDLYEVLCISNSFCHLKWVKLFQTLLGNISNY